jgi:two-component system sensor histidine kinase EvgS
MRRALAVDDDDTVRLLCKRQLRALGYDVDLAENGLQAVESVERAPFDVILMDVQMPEMDGYEAVRKIRQLEASLGRQRSIIIAITASQERERALEAGMDGFLFKPFVFEALKQIIDKLSTNRVTD